MNDYNKFHLIQMLQRMEKKINSLKRMHADGDYYVKADDVIKAINELISEMKGENK